MKTYLNTALVASCLLSNANYLSANEPFSNRPVIFGQIGFKENLGQISDQNYQPRKDVLFAGTEGNLVFHLKKYGISYQLNRVDSWKERDDLTTEQKNALLNLPKRREVDERTIYRVDVNWLNTNTKAQIKKENALEDYDNYYLSSCPNGALKVKSYAQLSYQQIYDGIDLKWYSKNGQLKYDYLVEAGADYKRIQFEIKGAEKILVTAKGDLQIETPLGTIIEQAPLVIQNKRTLSSKWKVVENIISFEIENIDPSQPFVIDPAVRVWGTFYGAESAAYSCKATENGDVYMTGSTSAAGLNIATTGVHQTTLNGESDAFLVKFNSGGSRIWCTYYGGSWWDDGSSCEVDLTGNVYMVGTTRSFTDAVIATVGAHQTSSGDPNGGGTDLFLVKFTSSGVRQWATYYGGEGDEDVGHCATDIFGNVFVSGQTKSTNGTLIATSGSHQLSNGGGLTDAFLVKFNSSGVRQWGTYYGGSGAETAYSCLTDKEGNSFISGATTSNGTLVMSTPGSHQSTFNSSGSYDCYLVKFNPAGVRQWGTYYGGSSNDVCSSSCIDKDGNIFLTGHTSSSSGIATPGAFKATYVGSSSFLTKFNNAGVLQWGTYYTRPSQGSFSATDIVGDVVFGGTTNAYDEIATPGSHQQIYGGGQGDVFITKFSSSGTHQWGTFYGGDNTDVSGGCSIDNTGNIFVAGTTQSFNDTAIATPGSYQPVYTHIPSTSDLSAFLVKLKDTETGIVGFNKKTLMNEEMIKVYPSPANGITNILIETSAQGNFYKIELINSLGQVCKTISLDKTNTKFSVNIHSVSSGIYTVCLKRLNGTFLCKKIVINE
ncbi:DUF7948 domain-containing protein [Aurantibacillus circumpalustris]|uniref:DUF7948 domain-containing protein n=1 Tax=Aurantibacillus circumpalustris TaxID=3036359 RepID=UPI00295C1480|nr:SBBP repeat-containing protein [Aurantibacillus circumpalustris]